MASRRVRLTLLAFGVVATASCPARADETASVVQIETYATAAGCPGEAAFRDQVAHRARRPAQGASALKVAVQVDRENGEHAGTILVTDVHGERSTRRVKAGRCDEVVSALALVAALAIDDATRTQEAAEPESSTPSPPVVAAPPPRAVERPVAPPEPSARRLAFRFGAQAAMQTGITPNPMMTVPVFIELGSDDRRPTHGLSARVEPSLRLAGIFGGSDRTTIGAAGAEMRWTSGAADLCIVRVRAGAASLLPCPRFELGILEGRGEQIVEARSERRTWTALALPVRLRLEPWSHVFFELEGAVRTPLVRDRFVFRPDSTVFRAPSIGLTAAIGAGLTFP